MGKRQKGGKQMSDEGGIQLERRQGAQDIHELACFSHKLDTRISVVEERMKIQDSRLSSIEKNVEEVRAGVGKVLECLHSHTQQEDKDRIRLLAAVVATLFSAIAGLAMAFLNRIS